MSFCLHKKCDSFQIFFETSLNYQARRLYGFEDLRQGRLRGEVEVFSTSAGRQPLLPLFLFTISKSLYLYALSCLRRKLAARYEKSNYFYGHFTIFTSGKSSRNQAQPIWRLKEMDG